MEASPLFQTHPSTAQQAKDFTAPSSLSFPGGAGHLTPPSSEKDGSSQQANGSRNGFVNGQSSAPAGSAVQAVTPAATPGQQGQGGVSGIVPTLQ